GSLMAGTFPWRVTDTAAIAMGDFTPVARCWDLAPGRQILCPSHAVFTEARRALAGRWRVTASPVL
ncbi:MAG TPA: hypothetical protein VFA48_01905, partial [Gammaproteobacteria bacterium]|nr:hypothetical protein [Gammaproteobacteria bacterium]